MKIGSKKLIDILNSTKELDNFFFNNQRKYLGNKASLINNFIDKAVREKLKTSSLINKERVTFLDLFSGTGSVSSYIKGEFDFQVIVNDYLYQNYLSSITFFGIKKESDYLDLIELIKELNDLEGIDGYCTQYWSDKYFSKDNCRKIDAIRERIEEYSDLPFAVKAGAITSLIYAIDKVANIAGIYTKWILSENPTTKPLELKIPAIDIYNNMKNNHIIKSELAEELIDDKDLEYDILYLDPPYFSRSYYEFYHVLENIARWEKPKLYYSSLREKWTDKCKTGFKGLDKTKRSFENIINNVCQNKNCKIIIMNYSNHGVMRKNYIKNTLVKFGKTNIRTRSNNGYDTGRGNNQKDYKEYLYISVRK